MCFLKYRKIGKEVEQERVHGAEQQSIERGVIDFVGGYHFVAAVLLLILIICTSVMLTLLYNIKLLLFNDMDVYKIYKRPDSHYS